ncbi:hypothetical protein GJAV_G00159000 [Gymnothorax javanicus]|nr:hypothetical protein GJAV_G00159000 [Gymnothorax javanicus]
MRLAGLSANSWIAAKMPSTVSVFTLFWVISAFLQNVRTHTNDLKESCSTCREITENFNKGYDRTAKKNFGGGNTAWEERKLSKYETSEIRLVEILEGLCDSSSFECNRMVEEHEEKIETWWFKRKTKHPDLFKWFCIEAIKVCCPKGTFGSDCNACVGGSERPCHGNGACDGDGTRAGNGRCSCKHGYQGEFCLDCSDGHFSSFRNDTFSVCSVCHTSCLTCTGRTNQDCVSCNPGWEKDEQGACNDVDECSQEAPPCKEDQYCLNTDGSYSCKACDKACTGCKGAGPGDCLTCSDGYREEEGSCIDVNECEQPDQEKDGVCVQVEEPESEESIEVPDSEVKDPTVAKLAEGHEDL